MPMSHDYAGTRRATFRSSDRKPNTGAPTPVDARTNRNKAPYLRHSHIYYSGRTPLLRVPSRWRLDQAYRISPLSPGDWIMSARRAQGPLYAKRVRRPWKICEACCSLRHSRASGSPGSAPRDRRRTQVTQRIHSSRLQAGPFSACPVMSEFFELLGRLSIGTEVYSGNAPRTE